MGMSDAIESLLQTAIDLTSGVTNDTSMLTQNLDTFLPELYQYSVTIMDTVMKPVAYSFLGFFCLIELKKFAEKMESSGGGSSLSSVKLLGLMGMKLGICMLVMSQLSLVLRGIMQVGIYLTTQISDLVSTGKGQSLVDISKLMGGIDDLGFWEGVGIYMLILIVALAALLANVIARVMIVMRFFELYILFALSPLPISTLPNEEWSQVGKNFFKKFVAAALQGVILFMVLSFFPILVSSGLQLDIADKLMSSIGLLLGYSVALVLCIIKAGQWAKSITTAT